MEFILDYLTEVAEAISVALATVFENPWRLRGRERCNMVYLFKLQKEKSKGIRDKGALLAPFSKILVQIV